MIGGWALPRVAWACALTLAAHTCAAADATADFYRGKTISLYVGFPPGGGYDLYARVLTPYFSRHIPGNPPIAIKTPPPRRGRGSRISSRQPLTHCRRCPIFL